MKELTVRAGTKIELEATQGITTEITRKQTSSLIY